MLKVQAKTRRPIRGLGDVVEKLAQPVAKLIDSVAGTDLQNCSGCEKRRQALNKTITFMKTAILIVFLLLAAFALPAQINVTYNLADFTQRPSSVVKVAMTPLEPFNNYNGTILVSSDIAQVTTAGGSVTFSNVVAGYDYRITMFLAGTSPTPATAPSFTNGFPVGLSGNVNGANYLGVKVGQVFFYSSAGGVTNNQALNGTNFAQFMVFTNSPGYGLGNALSINHYGMWNYGADGIQFYTTNSEFILTSNAMVFSLGNSGVPPTNLMLNASGLALWTGVFSGNGSGLSNITANVTNNQVLPGIPLTTNGIFAGAFSGNAKGLTNALPYNETSTRAIGSAFLGSGFLAERMETFLFLWVIL